MNEIQLRVINAEVLDSVETAILKRNQLLENHIAKNGDQLTGCFIVEWQQVLLKIRAFIVDEKFNKHEITKNGVHGSKILKFPADLSEYRKIKDIAQIKELALSFYEPYKVSEGYFPEITYSFESYEKYTDSILDFVRVLLDNGVIKIKGKTNG